MEPGFMGDKMFPGCLKMSVVVGDKTYTGPCQVEMDDNRHLTIYFEEEKPQQKEPSAIFKTRT
jgi:hypothetical protein